MFHEVLKSRLSCIEDCGSINFNILDKFIALFKSKELALCFVTGVVFIINLIIFLNILVRLVHRQRAIISIVDCINTIMVHIITIKLAKCFFD